MALVWRLTTAVFGALGKAAGLFLALFVVYLLVSRAWPTFREATDLAAQRPTLERQLAQLQGQLSDRQARLVQLQARIEAESAAQMRRLQQGVLGFERALERLKDEQQTLERRVAEARADEAAYCDTWNPLKRWMCREVQERIGRTLETLVPLLEAAKQRQLELEQQLEDARAALASWQRDPLGRGTSPEALAAGAELADTQTRAEQLRLLVTQTQAQLNQARVAEASPWAWLNTEVRKVGWRLGFIVLGVLLLPYAQRVVAYFVLMPLLQRAGAIRLLPGAASGKLCAGPSVRSLSMEVGTGQRCWSRSGYVRPVEGRTRSQWLFDWSAPLVSYAAGLSVVTRIEGPVEPGAAPARATLASPGSADSYLLELQLEGHPGVIVHPKHIVALAGEVELFTRWRLFSAHAWATGQLRFIGVRGTGSCILEGYGDIIAGEVTAGRARIEQELVLAFDTRLGYATARTETFLPYLLGRTPLVDDVFIGAGVFVWQKNTRAPPSSFVERGFDALFGALGKFLGF